MKLFECQHCGQPLYFENTHCEGCGRRLGYSPSRETMAALESDEGGWRTPAQPGVRYRLCANADYEVCTWLVNGDAREVVCAACSPNRTIPDLSLPENAAHWRKIEVAKPRLFYTLLKLRLPLTTRPEDPDGLAFDFIAGPQSPSQVITGHS